MHITQQMVREFLQTSRVLLEELKAIPSTNPRQALILFENKLTLLKLNELFQEVTLKSLPLPQFREKVITFFKQRWDRIRGTYCAYTEKHHEVILNYTNMFCLDIARVLSDIPDDIYDLPPGEGPYFILMPTLQVDKDITNCNIHEYRLHEFVLSDDDTLFIPVYTTLAYAEGSATGKPCHLCTTDPEMKKFSSLSPSELKRVTHHSQYAQNYYQCIQSYHTQRLYASSFCTALGKLYEALKKGSVAIDIGHGQEFDAHAYANEGIVQFFEYWNDLPEETQKFYFDKYPAHIVRKRISLTEVIEEEWPSLEEILGRLARPKSADYSEVLYCVYLLGDYIDPIIKQEIKENDNISRALEKMATQRRFLENKMQEPAFFSDETTNCPPRVFPPIFELSPEQQRNLFPDVECNSPWLYLLENDIEYLSEILKKNPSLLRSSSLFTILTKKLQSGDYFFTRIINKGHLPLAQTLLEAHPQLIIQTNQNGDYPHHIAARIGNIELLEYLLPFYKGNETNKEGDTCLHIACKTENVDVFQLVAPSCSILVRNRQHENALDIAIQISCGDIIDSIVLASASMDARSQRSLFSRVEGGIYESSLSYIVLKRSHLLTPFLHSPFHSDNLSVLRGSSGQVPLLITATKRIQNLHQIEVLVGFDAELLLSTDSQKNTALHWAIANKSYEIVKFLAPLYAARKIVNIRNKDYFTPLHLAVQAQDPELTEILLQAGADIALFTISGTGVLKFALGHPALFKRLLMAGLFLSLNKQSIYLGQITPNQTCVLSYIIEEQPFYFAEAMASLMSFENPIHLVDTLRSRDKAGNTPLLLCLRHLELSEVELLLANGANILDENHLGNNALHAVVSSSTGNDIREKVQLILQVAPQLISLVNKEKETPLHALLRNMDISVEDKIAIALLLIKAGNPLTVTDKSEKTLLNLLEELKSVQQQVTQHVMPTLLLNAIKLPVHEQQILLRSYNVRRGIAVLIFSPSFRFPDILWFAAERYPSLLEPLILQLRNLPASHCAILLNNKNLQKQTLLIHAVIIDNLALVNNLLAVNINVLLFDDAGCTALHYAKNKKIIRALIKKGAQLEAQNVDGQTPLLKALMDNYPSTAICELLESGASIDPIRAFPLLATRHDSLGMSLMKRLVLLTFRQQIEFLTLIGMQYVARNIYFFARLRYPGRESELIEVLEKNHALGNLKLLMESRDDQGKTPLYLATEAGAVNIVNQILRLCSSICLDVDSENGEIKDTALIAAARLGNEKIVKALLQNNAQVGKKTIHGNTALHLCASREVDVRIYNHLLQYGAKWDCENTFGNTPFDIALVNLNVPCLIIMMHYGLPLTLRGHNGLNILDCADRKVFAVGDVLTAAALLSPSEQVEILKKIDDGRYQNIFNFTQIKYPEHLPSVLKKAGKEQEYAKAKVQLQKFIPLQEHIETLTAKKLEMQDKQSNKKYARAYITLSALIQTLKEQEAAFLFSDVDEQTKKRKLKVTCLQAIEQAKEVLSEHRSLVKLLARIFIAILTAPISLPLYACGFFSFKTDTHQKLESLQKDLNTMQIGA
ncbi:ankyrin repeat-containing protein (plasmid) [Legionella adelaidensis]|uniref:Ankyrin repeat-containing protein n=1 Tax=Legionella adelaidensis TaxID=45056 RepID=A0A0W0R1S2_9GAMM|nr:ankyrin repeat domain-containing protein [Legionella adelaidensis]KTC64923.1 ankyrin repeat-containing protein [Legionella adelaidensis]VEH85606.1 ankyrin repeat-containing protein [Legionella adelaidensis]